MNRLNSEASRLPNLTPMIGPQHPADEDSAPAPQGATATPETSSLASHSELFADANAPQPVLRAPATTATGAQPLDNGAAGVPALNPQVVATLNGMASNASSNLHALAAWVASVAAAGPEAASECLRQLGPTFAAHGNRATATAVSAARLLAADLRRAVNANSADATWADFKKTWGLRLQVLENIEHPGVCRALLPARGTLTPELVKQAADRALEPAPDGGDIASQLERLIQAVSSSPGATAASEETLSLLELLIEGLRQDDPSHLHRATDPSPARAALVNTWSLPSARLMAAARPTEDASAPGGAPLISSVPNVANATIRSLFWRERVTGITALTVQEAAQAIATAPANQLEDLGWSLAEYGSHCPRHFLRDGLEALRILVVDVMALATANPAGAPSPEAIADFAHRWREGTANAADATDLGALVAGKTPADARSSLKSALITMRLADGANLEALARSPEASASSLEIAMAQSERRRHVRDAIVETVRHPQVAAALLTGDGRVDAPLVKGAAETFAANATDGFAELADDLEALRDRLLYRGAPGENVPLGGLQLTPEGHKTLNNFIASLRNTARYAPYTDDSPRLNYRSAFRLAWAHRSVA